MILAQLSHFASHTVNSLALFQEEQTVGFSPMQLWEHMAWMARSVAILLFIESVWSLAVMIDRYLYFSCRPQAVARVRAQGGRRPEGQQAGRSHQDRRPQQEVAPGRGGHGRLAGVPRIGRHGDRGNHRQRGPRPGEGGGHRARQAEERPGSSGDHRRHRSVRGAVRHRRRHSARLRAIATQKTSGIGAVAGGISEALVTTAFGLLVAIPAVMAFNYFTGRVEAFDVEMDNSSSELVDYFIKQSHKR